LGFNNTTCGPFISEVGFEVLTEATMKSYISWDIMPCNPMKLTDFWRIILPPSSCCLLVGLLFDPKCEGGMFL
jgi:hypothetical protein